MTGQYQIKQTPVGKFMIESGKASYGPFDNKASAEAGLKRLIDPPTYDYDVNGDEIK